MNLQKKRLLSQILFFFYANLGALNIKTGLCLPFFYCHACPTASSACPIRAIEQSVYKGNFGWRFLLYPFLILGTVGVISGRFVCAWACPIGFLQRGTAKIARKSTKYKLINKFLNSKYERYLRYVKYVNIIGLALVTSYLVGFMFTDICPVGFLTGTIPLLILYPGTFIPNYFFIPALFVFILFIILILIIERGWCRYFCPVGAILAPFNKISLLHINVNLEGCVHCYACNKVCPMGIDIPSTNRSPECILCGKCIDSCPNHVITLEKT